MAGDRGRTVDCEKGLFQCIGSRRAREGSRIYTAAQFLVGTLTRWVALAVIDFSDLSREEVRWPALAGGSRIYTAALKPWYFDTLVFVLAVLTYRWVEVDRLRDPGVTLPFRQMRWGLYTKVGEVRTHSYVGTCHSGKSYEKKNEVSRMSYEGWFTKC